MRIPTSRTLKKRINFILEHAVDRDDFIRDLPAICLRAAETGSREQLVEFIDSWFATAEIDSIPGMRKGILDGMEAIRSGKLPKGCRVYRPGDSVS